MQLPVPSPADLAVVHAMEMIAAMAATFEADRPVFDRLHQCRKDLDQQLQARKWNTYVALVAARSRRSSFKRRHKGRT